MRMRALAVGVVALWSVVGCAQAPATQESAEKPELTPEAKSLVLDQAPTDIASPLYIDFNGKAELLGFALEAGAVAAPGSRVTLKLYWRSTGELEPGYLPFTELVTPDGRRIEVDGSGPVRKGPLAPSNWETSKVYIDEVEFSVPDDINAARFSIVVGFRTSPIAPEEPAPADPAKPAEGTPKEAASGTFGPVYLSVISGPADSKHGGLIASVETGITPAVKRARKSKDDKRGAGSVRQPPPKPARSAVPPQ